MALLLETNLDGDLVIDLDLEGSPNLCRNVLKLAKARYFTSNLVFNVIQPNRFCQTGDPTGTGQGGSCIAGVLDSVDEEKSTKRFLKASSAGRELTSSIDLRKRGRVVCTELVGTPDTIGSQFSILLGHNEPGHGMDGFYTAEGEKPKIISLGQVTEDDNDVLTKLEQAYCDPAGRPFVDIRLRRVLVLHDPFEDPPELSEYLKNLADFKFDADGETVANSPNVLKPIRETVPERITADQLTLTNGEEDEEARLKEQESEARQQDHSRAVVLELLGDLPDADAKAPENVLFVCKLNRETQEEDLELIFSRFDPNVNVDLIRDYETGDSLQYAFVDFSTKEQCVEAYFKMDNALVDDRRIKVDFSQSVAKLWNRHTQQKRKKKMDNSKGSMSRNYNKSLSSGTKEGGKYRSVEQQGSHLEVGDRGTRNHQRSYQANREHFKQRHHDERHLQYRNDTRSGNSPHQRGEREGHKDHHRDRDENSRRRYDDKHYDRNHDERSRYRSRNYNDESERHRHDRYGDNYEGSKYRRKHHHHGNRHRHDSDDEEVCGRGRSLKSKDSREYDDAKESERRYSRRDSDDDRSYERDRKKREKHSRQKMHRKRNYSSDEEESYDRSRHLERNDEINYTYRNESSNRRKHRSDRKHQSEKDDRRGKSDNDRKSAREETSDSSDVDFSYVSVDEEKRERKRKKKLRKKRKRRREKREGDYSNSKREKKSK